MQLVVDGSIIEQDNSLAGLRSRRQNDEQRVGMAMLVYLGGGENQPMFNGCIKFPYFTQYVNRKQKK